MSPLHLPYISRKSRLGGGAHGGRQPVEAAVVGGGEEGREVRISEEGDAQLEGAPG